jgi:hypothetical protein
VELEPVTAQIAAALYPDAGIVNESFAGTRDREGTYDLAIGNVPFGALRLTGRQHNPGGHSIHNHFIIKALHLVRPGGLVAVVTSRYTMDARNPAARREIAGLADLTGAVRLPGREPDGTGWEQTRMAELDGTQIPVNEYFLDHPDAVLGDLRAVRGAYSAEDLVVASAGDTSALVPGHDNCHQSRVLSRPWSVLAKVSVTGWPGLLSLASLLRVGMTLLAALASTV